MENLIIGTLILTSIIGIAFIVERGLALRWKLIIPPEIGSGLQHCRTREQLPGLLKTCEAHPSPLGRLLQAASEFIDLPRAEVVDAVQTRARQEITRMERGLVILEIIVGIGPLLGLVGTIMGMMDLFDNLGVSGLGDSSVFASGIALALRATLLGLLVAIPALVAWSYYNRKVERMAIEMETLCDEFIRRQYRLRKSESTSAA